MDQITGRCGPIERVLRWGTATGDDDGRLVERFVSHRDEAAFAALVDRHGPMVLGVCRRALRNDRDVEDAFQATFLILARRAGTIRGGVGPWLHGVARKVALRARAAGARRYVREGSSLDAEPSADDPPGREAERGELWSILDDELGRLPERLRAPIALCHLEGLTHDQAAVALRQPVGTIRSRLSRGRDRLRDRLARRGVSADDAVRASIALAGPVPASLLEATLRSALAYAVTPTNALAAAGAAALAQGALETMLIPNAKLAALALGTILTVGGASGHALQGGGEAKTTSQSEPRGREDLQREMDSRLQEREFLTWRIESLKSELARVATPHDSAPQPDDSPKVAKRKAFRAGVSVAQAEKTLAASIERRKQELPELKSKLDMATEDYRSAVEALAHQQSMADRLSGLSGGMAKAKSSEPSDLSKAEGMPPDREVESPDDLRGRLVTEKRRYLETPKMIISASEGGRVVTGYSSETGEVTSIRLAEQGEAEIKVVPYLGMMLAALDLQGAAVKRIAVFSVTDGAWHPYDLVEPAGEASPVMCQSAVAYPIGRRIYAFSFVANSWDVLELPEEVQKRKLSDHPETLTYQGDGRLYIFSGRVGKWTTIDISKADDLSAFTLAP